MLNINDISKLEIKRIEYDLEQDRLSKLNRQKDKEERRKKNIEDALAAKDEAEKIFPSVLKSIEDDIKQKIEYGDNKIYCAAGKGLRDCYLKLMVITVLSMEGYKCILSENGNHVEVSW